MYTIIPTSVLLTDFKIKELNGCKNFTVVTEFILLGLTDNAELKVILFVLFLVIYVITLVGNLGMIFLIQITPKLHTPMYFSSAAFHFCGYLLFICYCTKLLISFLVVRQTISFCMHSAAFVFQGVHHHRRLLAVCDGLWPLCGHCQPFVHTAAMSKRKSVGLVLVLSLVEWSTHWPTISFGRFVFLQVQCHQALLLWCPHCWSCHVLIPPWTSCCS